MARYVYLFGGGKADGNATQKDLLGGKGAGLAEMSRLGIPVPPGFTITTEVAALFTAQGKLPDEVKPQVLDALSKVESLMDAKFGDPSRPLLVSVRSGARASMPGMLDTVLNLGINDEVAAGLVKQTENERFVYDAYRRFITMYADVVLGVPRSKFEEELTTVRRETAKKKGINPDLFNEEELRRRVPDSDIEAAELKALVPRFKAIVTDATKKPFPEDPMEQLLGAIGAVFASWNNHRARVYRKMHGIPESWGTACNVQAMVFGNMGDDSATGVCFTRNPSTGEKQFYGEWLPNAQGEDVVAGIRTPLPLTKEDATDGQDRKSVV